jgi:hypothetical protein
MFRAIAPHQFVNDAGIEISRKDRHAMEYRDGDHVLSLYCDPIASGDGRFGAAICLPHDVRWQPPFEHGLIDDVARARIETHLRDAWGVVDYRVTIES